MSENSEEKRKLVRLIREIAREVCYDVLDEHLDDYEHKERATEGVEAGQRA